MFGCINDYVNVTSIDILIVALLPDGQHCLLSSNQVTSLLGKGECKIMVSSCISIEQFNWHML